MPTRRQSSIAFPLLQSTKILDQVRERIRYLPYSICTEESYLYWIRFYIRWSGVRHPRDMGADKVRAFLTFLATERNVSASTHRVALSAILFLYQKVLSLQLAPRHLARWHQPPCDGADGVHATPGCTGAQTEAAPDPLSWGAGTECKAAKSGGAGAADGDRTSARW